MNGSPIHHPQSERKPIRPRCETLLPTVLVVLVTLGGTVAAPQKKIPPSTLNEADLTASISQQWDANHTVYFPRITVSNQGTAPTKTQFQVKVIGQVSRQSAPPSMAFFTVNPLGVRESWSASLGRMGYPRGQRAFITVFVDVSQRVRESNEGNNSASKWLPEE